MHECSGTSGSAAGADYCFEGAQSSATHALSVEHVCWDGIGDTQSRDDTADVIGPSQVTACVRAKNLISNAAMLSDPEWALLLVPGHYVLEWIGG